MEKIDGLLRILTWAFSGIAVTLIGVWWKDRLEKRRFRGYQINEMTSFTTGRENNLTFFALSSPPLPESVHPGPGKGQKHKDDDSQTAVSTFEIDERVVGSLQSSSQPIYEEYFNNDLSDDRNLALECSYKDNEPSVPDDIFFDWSKFEKAYIDKNRTTLSHPGFQIAAPQSVVIQKDSDPTLAISNFVPQTFWFDDPNTKIVGLDDGSTAVVSRDKLLFADQKDGLLLASKYDPDKWEEVEIRKTEEEFVYRLKKKR